MLFALLSIVSCRHHQKRAHIPSVPRPSDASKVFARGYTEEGVASWYGIPYHGRPAADGEIYNMETLVAAHRVMPFNTWLRVTNTRNLKSVDVRVIDRGPFVNGRIIDLSKAAARQIDLLGPGVGPVKLEVIAAPADVRSNDWYAVQLGAFSVRANAERLREKYANRFGSAQIAVKQGRSPLYRVLVGKEASMDEAQKIAAQLRSAGDNAMVVRLDETLTSPPTSSTALPAQP